MNQDKADMKPKLYLFTDAYPFGKGEKSFIDPELECLQMEYHVTIVSHASMGAYEDIDNRSDLPEGVDLIHCKGASRLQRLVGALSIPFSRIGRKEICQLFQDGISVGRTKDMLRSFATARYLHALYSREGLFRDEEEATYFTFWFNDQTLALAFEKERNPCIRIVSRIHRYDLYEEAMLHTRQPFQCIKRDATSKLLFLSDSALDYFTERYGNATAPGQYAVVPLGVVQSGVQPPKVAGQPFRIMSCSSVIPRKRVNLIAESLSLLGGEEVEWVHIGDGPSLVELQRYCEDNDVRLISPGYLNNDDIIDYYKKKYIDVFITTSSSEGSPVSIQEALSFGIPIIGTDVGAISDQIDGNGILLPCAPSREEVANAIKAIFRTSPGGIQRMRSRSFQIWKEKFDGSRNKELLIRVLLSL